MMGENNKYGAGFRTLRFLRSLRPIRGAINKRVSGFSTSCLRPNPAYSRTPDTRRTLYKMAGLISGDIGCLIKK